MGTLNNPDIPGYERILSSRRDASIHRGLWAKFDLQIFQPQPSRERGPDGKGPYRVTNFTDEGYTTEVFIPRSLFKVPVFCPGWYIGFDCFVVTGELKLAKPTGRGWIQTKPDIRTFGNFPERWGDLLLLGTDARLVIQDAAPTWARSEAVIPGRSYLITVIDPDRNVNLAAEDAVMVSGEVAWPGETRANDVDIFILQETGKNTSIFQGYVNTQPGRGGQVQGILEMMPGQEARFGYVDFADSQGRRNVIYEQKLPVVCEVMAVASGK
jgi:hypothetical protein